MAVTITAGHCAVTTLYVCFGQIYLISFQVWSEAVETEVWALPVQHSCRQKCHHYFKPLNNDNNSKNNLGSYILLFSSQ